MILNINNRQLESTKRAKSSVCFCHITTINIPFILVFRFLFERLQRSNIKLLCFFVAWYNRFWSPRVRHHIQSILLFRFWSILSHRTLSLMFLRRLQSSSTSIFVLLNLYSYLLRIFDIISCSDFISVLDSGVFMAFIFRSLFSWSGNVISEAISQIRLVGFKRRGEENWKRLESERNCSYVPLNC